MGWSATRDGSLGRRMLAVAVVLATATAGCAGGDETADPRPSPRPFAGDVTSPTADPTGEPTVDPDPVPTDDDTEPEGPAPAPTDTGDEAEPAMTDAPDEPDDEALAGTPIEMFWRVGEVLAVVGVAADDVLNVRARPGADQPIVGTLAPLTTDVEIVGETRLLRPGGFWAEVESGGTAGWVNVRYLAWIGATDDATSRVLPLLPDHGRAETMLALGEAVAATWTSGITEPGTRVVVVDGPTVDDLGEITVDVIGLADDSQYGVRLHVFAHLDEGGEGFGLKSVEETVLCGRGVSEGTDLCT